MKQVAVIGLGRFGYTVAVELCNLGFEVLAMDRDEELVDGILNEVNHAVVADATKKDALDELGLANFDIAVVAMGGYLEDSILAVMHIKEIGVPLVIAKANETRHGQVLERIGADRVVYPERDMGIRVARSLASPNLLDYIELSPGFSIAEINPTPGMVGRMLNDLKLRQRFNVNVLVIKHADKVNPVPRGEDIINLGDILIVAGSDMNIKRLRAAETV